MTAVKTLKIPFIRPNNVQTFRKRFKIVFFFFQFIYFFIWNSDSYLCISLRWTCWNLAEIIHITLQHIFNVNFFHLALLYYFDVDCIDEKLWKINQYVFPGWPIYIAVGQEQKLGHKEYVNNNQSFLGFWVSTRENQAFD